MTTKSPFRCPNCYGETLPADEAPCWKCGSGKSDRTARQKTNPALRLSSERMEEILYSADLVRDRIVEHRRWEVVHEVIFRHDGRLWRATYKVGATEYQSVDDPWGGADVECAGVVEVPSVDYQPAAEPTP